MTNRILITIVVSFLLSGCFNSNPSDEVAKNALIEYFRNDSAYFSIDSVEKINGWEDPNNSKIYTIKFKFNKNLNSQYQELVIKKASDIFNDLIGNKEIKDEKFPIEIFTSYEFKFFEENSRKYLEDLNNNKNEYRIFMQSCKKCIEVALTGNHNDWMTNIISASLGHAIIFFKYKHGIPVSHGETYNIPSDIELKFRKTENGWSLIN